MRLTTYLHPVPRLIMSGAMPLFYLYAFMACTRAALLQCLKIFRCFGVQNKNPFSGRKLHVSTILGWGVKETTLDILTHFATS